MGKQPWDDGGGETEHREVQPPPLHKHLALGFHRAGAIMYLQCLYYLSLGVAMALLVGTRFPRLTLFYLFDFATLTPRTPTGCCAIASFLLAAVAGAGFMLNVIETAKECLKFTATLYIIHLFICIVYGGWPASVTWWVVNITGFAIMALLGEYLCIRRELKEIPILRLHASV